jgi:hypothetical protein
VLKSKNDIQQLGAVYERYASAHSRALNNIEGVDNKNKFLLKYQEIVC